MPHNAARLLHSLLLLACTASALSAQSTPSGSVTGTVWDSLHARPLAGATISASALDSGRAAPGATAVSDSLGRFRFERLDAGRYALSFHEALLDSLAFAPLHELVVEPGRRYRTSLAVPSAATLRGMVCSGRQTDDGTGAMFGTVRDADADTPLAGAEVVVAWGERLLDAKARTVTPEIRESRVRADASGGYLLCGVPRNQQLVVQVQHDGRAGAVLRPRIANAAGLLALDVTFSADDAVSLASVESAAVAEARPGRAAIAGTVRGAKGEPVSGVQLRVAGAPQTARSDDGGGYTLTGLPAGTHDLEVRHLGYAFQRRPVELRSGRTIRQDVALERVVSLDSVNVVAQRIRYPEFERHKKQFPFGSFLDEEEIKRRKYQYLPLVLSTITGFQLAHGPGGKPGLRTLRGCTHVGEQGRTRRPQMNIVIDGLEFMDIADVALQDVAAIEGYWVGAEAPWEYRPGCAVVVIWTKNWAAKRAAALARNSTNASVVVP